MTGTLIFDPLLPWTLIWVVAAVGAVMLGFALWRGLRGWWLRGLAAAVLLLALANPAVQEEDRAPLSDIVIAVVDDSASQRIGTRPAQTAEALSSLEAEVAALDNTELRVIRVGDGDDNSGTLLMQALSEALAEEPRARIAGAFLISDGQVHDAGLAPEMPAPLHLIQTGEEDDWDRRLIVKNAPAFAIIGEEVRLTLRVEDQGAVPPGNAAAPLTIRVGAEPPVTVNVPVGEDMELPVTLPHGGMNVLQFSVATAEGEITDRNNAAMVQINGVRDRLRVLLVSGEPHAGERVWRNLLKSDASVDLVHFTILRPPEKQDGIPVSELSLIAFPTRELFVEKVSEFDLIIFDRYRLRGILPNSYLENVRDYVTNGGTVLVAAGPEFGTADSLYRSPLGQILPVEASGRVMEGGFRPELTDLGRRHPVTEGLEDLAPEGGWGRWFRHIDMRATRGQTVMEADGTPLLVLDRVGEGRVAVMGSDQLWLWGRGYEGGGPQLELTRRLAHWMMKEPELEEEALTATTEDETLTIQRRTVQDTPSGDVTVTGPDGESVVLPMEEVSPGRWQAEWQAPELGLYQLSQGDLETVVAVGPSAPKEFEETIATNEKLAGVITGTARIEQGEPDIRAVGEGRVAAGRGWLGITPRGAYLTQDVTVAALLPGWLYLLIAAALILTAWLREGRFTGRAA
ncbi:DUF7408 domain-containing protein [Falsirhodobacter xinxiangensis]|uniref:DUF7408 domain-containing protein n=1 Tax=Falsirhodobacter xinxiangensis TaxID=2530049 RepID=UPI0010AA4295|nr:hypothetical protein [Rhodobacter xinxiangensis]